MPADPIAVAFVSSHAREGGSERQLEWLLESIDSHWVRLVVSLEEGRLPDVARSQGHTTVVVPTGNRRLDIMRAAWPLRRALRRARPGIVHANGVKAAAVAGLATVGTGIPVVWVKHDFSMDGRVAALVARRCALVVGVSQAVLRTFDGRAAPRRRVVHNGVPEVPVDRERGRALATGAFGPGPPAVLVALVGRLEADKGHGEVLAILPALRARVPDMGILFLGGAGLESPYARELVAQVEKLGLTGVVRFVPHREDARDLLSGCELLLHTSIPGDGRADTEGFPLVALEAMFAGTPVAGYANGGLQELVAGTGRTVPPGDRSALAEATLELLADAGLRAELGRRGRERVRERFLMPANVAALQTCYREALG